MNKTRYLFDGDFIGRFHAKLGFNCRYLNWLP